MEGPLDEYLVSYYRAREQSARAAAAAAKSDEVRQIHLQFARDYALGILEEQEKRGPHPGL